MSFRNSAISVAFSSIVWSSGRLPNSVKRFFVSKALGKSCSSNTVEAVSSHLTKYHTMRNMLFNLHTAYNKLAETPDWAFMREKKDIIAFLFDSDDPWRPMQTCEEISRQVPGIALSIEREGHGHFFCCFEDGSIWVAHHVATLINNQISRSRPIH